MGQMKSLKYLTAPNENDIGACTANVQSTMKR
jgi:hypothetical protein